MYLTTEKPFFSTDHIPLDIVYATPWRGINRQSQALQDNFGRLGSEIEILVPENVSSSLGDTHCSCFPGIPGTHSWNGQVDAGSRATGESGPCAQGGMGLGLCPHGACEAHLQRRGNAEVQSVWACLTMQSF